MMKYPAALSGIKTVIHTTTTTTTLGYEGTEHITRNKRVCSNQDARKQQTHHCCALTRNANGAPSGTFSGASSTEQPLSAIFPTHVWFPPHPEKAVSLPRCKIYHRRHHSSLFSLAFRMSVEAVGVAIEGAGGGGVGSGGHDCPNKKPLVSCSFVFCGIKSRLCFQGEA